MRLPIIALAAFAALAACHHGGGAGNGLANTADRLADEADNWGDTASNQLDDAGDHTQNRIAALDNRMAGLVDPPVADGWIGSWKGAGGRRLTIARAAGKAPGHYLITDAYASVRHGSFDGVARADTIVFTRPDGEQTLRATDGKGTGVATLVRKSDCLLVKPGEGYCRD